MTPNSSPVKILLKSILKAFIGALQSRVEGVLVAGRQYEKPDKLSGDAGERERTTANKDVRKFD